MAKRQNGVLVSMVRGKTLAYALFTLQERGRLFWATLKKCMKAKSLGYTAAITT